ncbi:IS3 family transposase [bacterium]|nr:IS3 family transposase [bacterium]
MKYAFITSVRGEYRVRKLCRVLQVSASGYYAWCTRPPIESVQKNEQLVKEIKRVHEESKNTYGSEKTWKALTSQGIACGKHKVARLRRLNGIESKRRRRFKVTTESKTTKAIAPNHLNQCFQVCQPNQVWVGDVTFIATRAGWLYLAIVLDLFARKIVGWSMSNKNNTQLVFNALDMALLRRRPKAEVLHHTDRGSTYGSEEYQTKLFTHGLKPSMSRKGNCYDNAVAESFFSTIKNELIFDKSFVMREDARKEIFEYIEIFYNRQRLHQTLSYQTPEQAEKKLVAA